MLFRSPPVVAGVTLLPMAWPRTDGPSRERPCRTASRSLELPIHHCPVLLPTTGGHRRGWSVLTPTGAMPPAPPLPISPPWTSGVVTAHVLRPATSPSSLRPLLLPMGLLSAARRMCCTYAYSGRSHALCLLIYRFSLWPRSQALAGQLLLWIYSSLGQ